MFIRNILSFRVGLFCNSITPSQVGSTSGSHLFEQQSCAWVRGCTIQAMSTKQSNSIHFLHCLLYNQHNLHGAYHLFSGFILNHCGPLAESGFHEWVAQSISTALVCVIQCFLAAFVCQKHCGDESRGSQQRGLRGHMGTSWCERYWLVTIADMLKGEISVV